MKFIANPVEVEAEEIVAVSQILDDGCMHLALKNGVNFFTDKSMLARYTPVVGDFMVRQADGYEYLNPREVFLRKYRPASVNDMDPQWWGHLMPTDEVAGPAKAKQ